MPRPPLHRPHAQHEQTIKVNSNPDKTCIVTGATGGIGSAIVDSLVRRDTPHITLAVRNTEAGLRLAERYASASTIFSVRHLDLASFDSTKQFAEGITAEGLSVDKLINNAGMLARRLTVTADGYEATMQVNFLAPVLLTNLLLPSLTNGSSVLFTSSFMRRVAYIEPDWMGLSIHHFNRFVVYAWSKLMLTQIAREMASAMACRGIRLNCTDPGIVNTEILRLGNSFVDSLADHLLRPVIRTPQQAAEATTKALDSQIYSQIFTRRGYSAIAFRDPQHISEKAVADMMQKVNTL